MNALASSHGARIQTSHSSCVVRITGIALGSAQPPRSARSSGSRRPGEGRGSGLDFAPRSPLNSVQTPANANSGRSSLSANHTTSFFLVSRFGSGAYSAKLLNGTRQRFSKTPIVPNSGRLSKPEKALVQQIAAMQIRIEQLQAAIVEGSDVDPDQIIRLSSEHRRRLNTLRAKAGQRQPDGPSVEDLFAVHDEAEEAGAE